MKTGIGPHKGKLPTRFDELNRALPLRPIDDDVSLDNAQEMADALALPRRRTADQEDYLETLSTLIEKYEDEHSPRGVGAFGSD